MRKLAIAMALASTALATPAVARDNTWYVGVEGGLMLVQDGDFNSSATFNGNTDEDEQTLEHKTGYDLDLIGGYDFGMFRGEVEAGFKRAGLNELRSRTGTQDIDGSVRVFSVMGNLLLDFGNDDDWTGYIGGGAGLANVRYKIEIDEVGGTDSGSGSDRSIAFQAIAGVRKPISNNLDVGLKYRFFIAPKLDYDIDFGQTSTKFRSHSLLASLTYNFAPPVVILPPPPPIAPPPPPPATQTCYDGSVILATDMCPQPPAPPPPPPPEAVPERG